MGRSPGEQSVTEIEVIAAALRGDLPRVRTEQLPWARGVLQRLEERCRISADESGATRARAAREALS